MTDKDGNPIPGRGEEYLTPVNAGAVRIVDAAGTTLNLAAKNGTSFAFDVANREFVPAVTSSPFKRSAGIGTIVESGKSAYVLDDFDFVNYWFYDRKGLGRITLLAGKERNNPRSGVLVMIVSPSSDNSIIIRETVYKAASVSALRIVSAADDVITLISDNDLIYDFNVTGQRFVTLPSDIDAPIVIPLITEASGNGLGLSVATPTKTSMGTSAQTQTPQPTRTALPTYNPYP